MRQNKFTAGFTNVSRLPQSREYLELAGKAEEKRLVEGLVENQKRILELVKENPFTAFLKKKGLLRRVGPAKGGCWEVVER